ncbi:glyoxylate/hydroxypyruvate reductase A [Rhodophyticola sp. CCM32]|uniref:2-hydroxyacid dehydrogenase n=1 Tax=Rhodophyticola sp. CCM32 TaxID=2916397 RepID=UPI00107F885A|nr:glyoxylate/hydroxypyruvate reductase A [Rhodophyticola sp. CCM32]QBY02478.1 glyoxylate/hydroxypyruvate reductase A [Rhodophyticola sp. CCM32]
MPNILFAARPERWTQYERPLRNALVEAGLPGANLTTRADPAEVEYIIYAPNGPVSDFTPYTRLKAVLNLWAGVEDVVGNTTLTVPLARMVDYGLTEGMVDWVVAHTMRHHIGIDAHIHGQDGVWRAGIVPPLARDRRVAILGLGALGSASATALAGLNFQVSGWSRSPKQIDGIRTFHGPDGLQKILKSAEIVTLLLPDTPATEAVLNADTFAMMPKGAVILNPGRGALIDDTALLNALDTGRISHATLDTFRVEPLPETHPFWAHPKVTVTPHIASETRVESAAKVIIDNIRRGETGAPFLHLVDRDLGY